MPAPRPSLLAILLAGTTATLVVGGLLILLLTLDTPPVVAWGFRGFPTVFAIASAAIGWLVMVRRPENRIGLILALLGVLNAAQLFLTEYAALAARADLPAAGLAGSINAVIWVPTVVLLFGALPLLLPDGNLPSAAWRPVAWLMVASSAVLGVLVAAYPDALGVHRFVDRLIALPIDDATINALAYAAVASLGVSIAAAAVSLVRRWRQASGVVRDQLKWVALSGGLIAATMWLSLVPNPLANAVFILAGGSIPFAVGIAILRHRLYDIDTVISRTLVFGSLTAILTGLFAGLQKLFQAIFVGATGNESDAALVITTLILAAGFAPLKSSLDRVVSRRFQPKGGEATAAAVPAPTSVDPAAMEGLLRRVVREELQAALREPGAGTARK